MNAFPTGGAARADRYELPHAPDDVEASILGGILLRPDVLSLLDALEPEDFYRNQHKVVFAAIRNLAAAGRPIDRVLVENEIEKAGKLDAIGGAGFLAELTLKVPTTDNVAVYAEEVRLASRNRRALLELGAALDRGRRGTYEPTELLLETIGELQRVAEQIAPQVDGASRPGRWIQPLSSFLGDEEPDDNDDADWLIRDIIARGEAGLIAGPPKGGKTWAMLDIGIAVALGQDWIGTCANTLGRPGRVLCLAFEDGQRRLRKRVWELMRARGATPNDHVLREHLSVGREPLSLPGDERALAAELKAWKPDLVLVDNLTRVMVGDQNAIKDAKRFGDVIARLCTDTGAAVVFLHHTNKIGPIDPRQRSVGDPFELIRGSGDIVAAARHLVLMRPLESPDATKLSDVRMRGNLDLRREDFVLGFDRPQLQIASGETRWSAALSFRGEGEAIHDEIEAKRRERAAERKARLLGGDSDQSTDDRVYAKILELVGSGCRDLCTLEQIRTSCGLQTQRVRPAIDRLIHAGRVRADQVRRYEGKGRRTRAIYVPVETESK